MIIIIIILKDFGQNRIKSPSKIKCVHSIMNMRMCTGIGNLGQKHLILAFLLFPHTTNKNKCTSGHNARGKLNIELILDRKLSRRSVLQATCDPKDPFEEMLSLGGANPKVGQWKGRVRRSKLQEMTSFNNKQHHYGFGLGLPVKEFKRRG